MTHRLVAALVLAATMLSACGTTTPTTPPAAVTVVRQPTAIPPTPAPPTVAPNATPSLVPGPNIAYGSVHLTLNAALGSGVSARLVPEAIFTDPNAPIHPPYPELIFVNYPLQNTFHEPRLQVYPADEFAKVNPAAADAIQQLQALLGQAPKLPAGNIPFLPVFHAAQVIRADIQFVNFQNGSGIRFVTQYGQSPIPINNYELFYTFQGLTNDGAYYVSAILPLSAPFLAPDDNPNHPAPADAVPAPDFSSPDFSGAAWGAYLDTVTTRLNQLDPQQFNPALAALDALVQSLEVK